MFQGDVLLPRAPRRRQIHAAQAACAREVAIAGFFMRDALFSRSMDAIRFVRLDRKV